MNDRLAVSTMRSFHFSLAAVLFAALGGCMGETRTIYVTDPAKTQNTNNSNGSTDTELGAATRFEKFERRVERQAKLFEDVRALAGAKYSSVPVSGTALFAGISTLRIDGDTSRNLREMNVIGYTEVTADFGASQLTGQIGFLQGHLGRNAKSGEIANFEGDIRIGQSRSQIGDEPDPDLAGTPNRFYADYAGILNSRIGNIVVSGGLSGLMRGTRVNQPEGLSNIKAVEATDKAPQITVDGVARSGSLTVVGKNN